MHSTKVIILGRDGILNEYREDHVKSAQEWVAVKGALEAVSRLNHAGWHVVVATNQAGIGRGMIDMSTINAVHAEMHRQLIAEGGRIDAVFTQVREQARRQRVVFGVERNHEGRPFCVTAR